MPKQSKLRFNRRRRRGRKKYGRIRKPIALKAHTFMEKFEREIAVNSTTLLSDGTLSSGYAKSFSLDDIAQQQSYKELFDSFIIHKVVAEIRYDMFPQLYQSTSGYQPMNTVYPLLLIKNDHNDVTGEMYSAMLESQKSRQIQLRPGKTIKHVLKPAVQVEAYKTALSSAYQPKWNCELRSLDSSTPHYGLKIQLKTQPSQSNLDLGKVHITYKMYFTMKNAD